MISNPPVSILVFDAFARTNAAQQAIEIGAPLLWTNITNAWFTQNGIAFTSSDDSYAMASFIHADKIYEVYLRITSHTGDSLARIAITRFDSNNLYYIEFEAKNNKDSVISFFRRSGGVDTLVGTDTLPDNANKDSLRASIWIDTINYNIQFRLVSLDINDVELDSVTSAIIALNLTGMGQELGFGSGNLNGQVTLEIREFGVIAERSLVNIDPSLKANGNYVGGNSLRGYLPAQSDFQVSVVPVERVEGGSTQALVIEDDANLDSQTSATVYNEALINSDSISSQYFSDRPQIATVDMDGSVHWVTNGSTTISVQGAKSGKSVPVSVSRDEGQAANVFLGYVAGSLADHCCKAIDDRLALALPFAASGKIYAGGQYYGARNPDCWLAKIPGLDLTCISPYNTYGANKKGGCLITPRHMVHAEHYALIVGAIVYFYDMNGVEYSAVVDELYHIKSPTIVDETDLLIARFSTSLSTVIKPAKILPTNYALYLPHIIEGNESVMLGNFLPVAAFCTDFEEKALVVEHTYNLWYGEGPSGGTKHRVFYVYDPTTLPRMDYCETRISGDSGNPNFLIINNELVCLGCFLSPYGGTALLYYQSEIAAYTQQVGLSPSIVDLTSFPVY